MLRSSFFETTVSMQIQYLHLAKLKQKLLTRRVVPRSFKCRPLLLNINTLMFVLSTKYIFSLSNLRLHSFLCCSIYHFGRLDQTQIPYFWGCWFQRWFHPLTWCFIPFVVAPGIDFTATGNFILLLILHPLIFFTIESPIMSVFFGLCLQCHLNWMIYLQCKVDYFCEILYRCH